jgi:hypothetical protein
VAAMSSTVSLTGVMASPSSRCTRALLTRSCASSAAPAANSYSGKRSCRRGGVASSRVPNRVCHTAVQRSLGSPTMASK